MSFGAVTLDALSAFVELELTAREAGRSQVARFALRLPLDGAPADRGSQLLRAMCGLCSTVNGYSALP